MALEGSTSANISVRLYPRWVRTGRGPGTEIINGVVSAHIVAHAHPRWREKMKCRRGSIFICTQVDSACICIRICTTQSGHTPRTTMRRRSYTTYTFPILLRIGNTSQNVRKQRGGNGINTDGNIKVRIILRTTTPCDQHLSMQHGRKHGSS